MFIEKLNNAWRQQDSLVCVGLDPDIDRLPTSLSGKDLLFQFNREIIDATAPWVCAFKPQIAYYAAIAAEDQLAKTIDYIRSNYPSIVIILDAKRGDIGATAKMYAREAFERYEADAVTVNPYMGGDTLEPFLAYPDRGVIILCRTSNPGSGDIQQLSVAGESVALHVAQLAASCWNTRNNVGLVVGATYPEQIRAVRKLVGTMPMLIPGIGTQGGDLEKVLSGGLDRDGLGLVINVSRSVIYASSGADFATAAGDQTRLLCKQVNQIKFKGR